MVGIKFGDHCRGNRCSEKSPTDFRVGQEADDVRLIHLACIRVSVKTRLRVALQKGDKVVTTGGIYGRIDEIKDQIIFLEVGPNIKLKVDKSVVLKDMSDAPVAAK